MVNFVIFTVVGGTDRTGDAVDRVQQAMSISKKISEQFMRDSRIHQPLLFHVLWACTGDVIQLPACSIVQINIICGFYIWIDVSAQLCMFGWAFVCRNAALLISSQSSQHSFKLIIGGRPPADMRCVNLQSRMDRCRMLFARRFPECPEKDADGASQKGPMH